MPPKQGSIDGRAELFVAGSGNVFETRARFVVRPISSFFHEEALPQLAGRVLHRALRQKTRQLTSPLGSHPDIGT